MPWAARRSTASRISGGPSKSMSATQRGSRPSRPARRRPRSHFSEAVPRRSYHPVEERRRGRRRRPGRNRRSWRALSPVRAPAVKGSRASRGRRHTGRKTGAMESRGGDGPVGAEGRAVDRPPVPATTEPWPKSPSPGTSTSCRCCSKSASILDSSLDLRDVLGPVLKAVARSTGILRGTLTLLNRRDRRDLHRGRLRPVHLASSAGGATASGRGSSGKVFQTGKPAIVPKISEEPLLPQPHRRARPGRRAGDLLHLRAHQAGEGVIGALSVDRPVREGASLEEDVRLLSIIASMIAQAVRLRQEAQEEQQRLIEENTRLQRGAEGPLPALQHHRQLQRHAGGLRPDRPGVRQRRHGADPRGERHRQGAGGPRHPLQQPPGRQAVHQGQLRRPAGVGHRERAVRPREGRLHRGGGHAQGALRAGPRRHPLPGRGRRPVADDPDQAAAGAPGAGVRAGRRHARRSRWTCGSSPPPTATWRS